MPVEAILAGIAFIGLFALWVVIPSKVRKQQQRSASVSLFRERE